MAVVQGPDADDRTGGALENVVLPMTARAVVGVDEVHSSTELEPRRGLSGCPFTVGRTEPKEEDGSLSPTRTTLGGFLPSDGSSDDFYNKETLPTKYITFTLQVRSCKI